MKVWGIRSVGLFLCLMGIAQAEDRLTDPKEIIKRTKEAMANFTTVSYEASIEATDWLKEFVADTRGKAVVGRPGEYDVPRFFCEVELKKHDSEQTAAYKAGCDGKSYFLIDAATKMAHEDIDPIVLGSSSRDIQRIVLRELNDKEAFKAELESEKPELREATEVGGEPCYQIYFPLKNAQAKSVLWEISTKDFWPRRVTRWYANFRNPEGPEATTLTTLSNVKVNPTFDNDPFKLVVPEGFKKTDEFAP